MKYRDYIPARKLLYPIFQSLAVKGLYEIRLKFPISEIKYDKRLFVNELSHPCVLEMLLNFDREYWDAVMISEDAYLVDGQHRLAVAKLMGIKYIDAVIRKSGAESTFDKRKLRRVRRGQEKYIQT